MLYEVITFQDSLAAGTTAAGKPREGYSVELTLDSAMQYELEKLSRKTMEETKAEAMMMLAVDAKSGEILAYVSEPAADLMTYRITSYNVCYTKLLRSPFGRFGRLRRAQNRLYRRIGV